MVQVEIPVLVVVHCNRAGEAFSNFDIAIVVIFERQGNWHDWNVVVYYACPGVKQVQSFPLRLSEPLLPPFVIPHKVNIQEIGQLIVPFSKLEGYAE